MRRTPLRPALVWGAAILLMMAMAAVLLLGLPRQSIEKAAPLQVPDLERPAYRVHLKYADDSRLLTVTEDVHWVNTETETFDRLCFRVNAAAYTDQTTAPGMAEDLFDTAYPDGFEAAELRQDGCWVNDALVQTEFDADNPVILWVNADVAPGESVDIRLRLRMKIPRCAMPFGVSDDVVRLVQALPALAARTAGHWDTSALSAYGAPPVMDASDVSITADLPEGYTLVCGAESASNQLSCLLLPGQWAAVSARVEGTECCVWAPTETKAQEMLTAAKAVWPVLVRRYGALPLPRLTLISLALSDRGFSAPGLVLLSNQLQPDELEFAAAYWLSGQWFGWAVHGEAWLDCSAREWAALHTVAALRGQETADALKYLEVDLPMRENLHASVTPGMPGSEFPDLAVYHAVMNGRGAAFLYAADLWMDGRLDAFLVRLLTGHSFERISREVFLKEARLLTGKDMEPLLTDWIDTKM